MKKFKKISFYLLLFLIVGFTGAVLFSPYKKQSGDTVRRVVSEIEINTNSHKIFTFLGNSNNAPKWSVFVDKITTLNSEKVDDGKVGSVRRCFRYSDKIQWDETITEVIPDKKRQLICYNLIGFSMQTKGIATEQIYIPISENKTKLVFSFFIKDTEVGFWELLKLKIGAFKVKSIFDKNIGNIKKCVENNE